MIPTRRLLSLSLCWMVPAVAAAIWPLWIPIWKGFGLIAGIITLGDMFALCLRKPMLVRRVLPERFALGEPGEVMLALTNTGRKRTQIEVFDGIPQHAVAEFMPWSGKLPPLRETKVFHPVKLMERGEMVFGPVRVRHRSPLGLWTRLTSHGNAEKVKVYPNYEPVVRFALLAMQHRDNPLGIIRSPRPGTSRDFHQLRDYRDGDPFSQIDWKATSRRQMLISRDYQEQRDQSVVFLLDTGRRMRAMDGGLPQFDHVLNAVLLVAHVALRQGDQVAVKSFGGSDRWLPPVKGSHAMPVLLNHLYDCQTTAAASDFSEAVEKLMTRQRRRSLVILLTNLRGEDNAELLPALRVLQSRHLVLLATMREEVVRDAIQKPVDSLNSALRHLAAERYLLERREILARLETLGILTLDSTAKNLPVSLANRYTDIKAAGRL